MRATDAITVLSGIGPQLARRYKKLGIETVFDLLMAFPFRYDDFRVVEGIAQVQPGQVTTIQGTVTAIRTRRSPRKRMTLTEATVEDGTGTITAVWFHQPYLAKTLSVGDTVSLAGKIDNRFGLSIVNPQFEKQSQQAPNTHTGRLVPVYSVTAKMGQTGRRNAVRRALRAVEGIEEWIPDALMQTYDILPLAEAIPELHFPEDETRWQRAIRRMKFGELLLHQLMHEQSRVLLERVEGVPIPFQEQRIRTFVQSLPFTLTAAQKRCAYALVQDMEQDTPMHRLLEGDVGSGKSVVAAIGALHVVAGGYQAAYLAPTAILAGQQYERFLELFSDLSVALLTQSAQSIDGAPSTREAVLEALQDGRIDIVIGTHALLQGGVAIPRLALVIVDEQHRFGVEQRRQLLASLGERVPHFLSMTATPIPRTLAMALYGDMDISILDELPAGRGEVETVLLRTGQGDSAYALMTERLAKGEQAYVVCPFIEASEMSNAESVTELTERLQSGPLRAFTVEALHGKLKASEKEERMERFRSGEIDVLVSTTVIEVGVNAPNASMILIEGAERFGLAQLHQLRGRVRRSERDALCFLHPTTLSGTTKERMEALVEHDNGFTLAEIDLKLRGSGDRFGTRQSGEQEFQFASLADHALITQAKEAAQRVLQEDPDLEDHPALRTELEAFSEKLRG